jgi:hypothetical protein
MKKTTRTSIAGKALSEKIGQLKMSAPDGNSVFCGLKTLAFSLQPLALACVLGKFSGTDQLRNGAP